MSKKYEDILCCFSGIGGSHNYLFAHLQDNRPLVPEIEMTVLPGWLISSATTRDTYDTYLLLTVVQGKMGTKMGTKTALLSTSVWRVPMDLHPVLAHQDLANTVASFVWVGIWPLQCSNRLYYGVVWSWSRCCVCLQNQLNFFPPNGGKKSQLIPTWQFYGSCLTLVSFSSSSPILSSKWCSPWWSLLLCL